MGNKILIADDNKEMRETLSKMLAGYEVAEAADGETAWATAVFELPDLILLDVDMPGMNGIDVLKKTAGLPGRPSVIIITGDRSKETASKAGEIGVCAYLLKPLDRDEVLAQVRLALDKREKDRKV